MWESDNGQINALKLEETLDELFDTVHTGSVSLFGVKPISFTAYFARQGNEIWLTSKETTDHVIAISDKTLDVAVCIWKQPLEWGEPLYGAQFAGTINLVVDEIDANRGLDALHNRFPGTKDTLPDVDHVMGSEKVTCLQRIFMSTGKIRDERRIGKGMFEISWKGAK